MAKHAARIGYYTSMQFMMRHGMSRDLASAIWCAGIGAR